MDHNYYTIESLIEQAKLITQWGSHKQSLQFQNKIGLSHQMTW